MSWREMLEVHATTWTLCHLQVSVCFSLAHFLFQFASRKRKDFFISMFKQKIWTAKLTSSGPRRWRKESIMNFDLSISWKMPAHRRNGQILLVTFNAQFKFNALNPFSFSRRTRKVSVCGSVCIGWVVGTLSRVKWPLKRWTVRPFCRDVTNFWCIFYALALNRQRQPACVFLWVSVDKTKIHILRGGLVLVAAQPRLFSCVKNKGNRFKSAIFCVNIEYLNFHKKGNINKNKGLYIIHGRGFEFKVLSNIKPKFV